MLDPLTQRRYLVPFKASRLPQQFTDVLIIGGGGAGLCDDEPVRITVEEGPKRVLELLSWGINFDKKVGNPYDLAFTREGGHSFARILHAYGDATGRELAKTLINTVRGRDNIRVSEGSFAIDLITDGEGSGFGVQGSGEVKTASSSS